MRTELCLNVFKNYKRIKKNKIPIVYYNKYFDKKLDLKVCDFYWASSRKSYLPCGQTCDICSYDAIRLCLLSGARLIDIDIYSDESGTMPIIRSRVPMPEFMSGLKTYLDLEKCLYIIKKYAWIDESTYPLILYLNIQTNNRMVLYNLTQILNKVFKGRFLNKRYSFSGRNGQYPFGQIFIKELFGNVAIITNKYPIMGILDEYINGTVGQNQKFISQIDYVPSMSEYGGIISRNNNVGDMINNNKFNVTIINSESENQSKIDHSSECLFVQNFRNPKIDLYNADPEDCWKLGNQFVLMNYQLYDDNMKKYVEKFKESSLVLKPESLRYIAKPKELLVDQNKKASYIPRIISQTGWYNYKI